MLLLSFIRVFLCFLMDVKTAKKLMGCVSYSQSRNRVNRRPVKDIEITENDLMRKYREQNGRCYWSGLFLDPNFNRVKHHPFAISVERLDNSKGYTYDNTVLTRRIFNLGRMAFPEREFRRVIQLLKDEMRDDN